MIYIQVEQIHKIFKLCGSPPEEYWKQSRMPHATVFKPQHPYENCLQETFDTLPESAFELLETFLSIEPNKRGTASAALTSKVTLVQNLVSALLKSIISLLFILLMIFLSVE